MATKIKWDGTESQINLKNHTLQELVGGYAELVSCGEKRMLVNEDGRRLDLPMNKKASKLAGQIIVGDVVVCTSEEIHDA